MSYAAQLLLLATVMVAVMSGGWLWQRRHRNAGIVDVLWSSGLGMAALIMAVSGSGATLPRLALAVLGTLWSLRLALYLWLRLRRETEDGRYRYLRAHWNDSQSRFFVFFQAQALLVVLFALPFMAVAANPQPRATPWTLLALAVFVFSVAMESLADRQLSRFRADPAQRGKTCRSGLWRYSRHPNYFFEWLHWFTYVALAAGSPIGWLAWTGPVAMYVFLRWISGVPYTEAQALRSRGADYREYQRSTPMLFPWLPRCKPSRDQS